MTVPDASSHGRDNEPWPAPQLQAWARSNAQRTAGMQRIRDTEPSDSTVLIFINGARVRLFPGFVFDLLINARFQLFVLACISFFAIVCPYRVHTLLEPWQAISILILMAIAVMSTYLGAFALLFRFRSRLRVRRFHTVWLILLTSFLASFLGARIVTELLGSQVSIHFSLGLWAFHFAVFTGMEVLLVIFVVPAVVRAATRELPEETWLPTLTQGSAAPVPAPSPQNAVEREAPRVPLPPDEPLPSLLVETPTIGFAGRRIAADEIRWVASQEHYISISMFDGESHFLRGRFGDLIEQVPEDLGYCIHRSHWVAWQGIERVETLRDSTFVVLDDKTELPVARGRRSDFIARWNRRATK